MWGKLNLPIFLFNEGLFTLMNMDSLIFLAKSCPSLPIIWKLCWVVEWPVFLAMVMCRRGIHQVLFISFSKGHGGLSYVFIITCKVTTLEPIYNPTFVGHWVFVSGGRPVGFCWCCYLWSGFVYHTPTNLFNVFAETLGVWYNYVTLGFNFIGKGLSTCRTLAVSSIIDLTGWPSKSFLHLVQSLLGVFTIGESLPEMLHFFLEELWIATHCFGPMGEGTNNTVFSWEMMIAVSL